jgi:glycosyltransferase involved in cell wall biosynthesis
MKITLLIPTLNEIIGMKIIMPQIKKEWVDQILIVDGGSDDGTIEWSRESGYEVVIQKTPGIRGAYMDALPSVQGDIILTFSPDGNCMPEQIPELVEKMKEGYDMVIASRYFEGAKSEDDDIITAFGNWLFTKTVNILFWTNYTDSMVIYRAYKKSLISELGLDLDSSYSTPEWLFRTNLSWEPMLSARAARRKLKLGEILGTEPARIGGERKLQVWRWGAGYYFQFWRDFFLFR